MKNFFPFFILLLFIVHELNAQCPPSNEPGIHVVQPDENLYRISRMYGMSLKRLMALNNMNENDLLPACKKLKIDNGKVQPRDIRATQSSTASTMASNQGSATPLSSQSTVLPSESRQPGNRHVVQPGETAAALAQLYGYTEERFREFNAMGNEALTPGSIILSHDCACDRVSYPVNATPTTDSNISGESTTYQPNTTTFYEPAKPTRITANHDPISPEDLGRSNTNTTNNNSTTNQINNNSTSSNPGINAPYMHSIEMEMLREINMMRANPPAYIKYINQYVADQRANNGFPVDQAVVDELNAELSKLGPLSQLQPKECIYIAAKKHGQDILRMGRTDHVGSDGKWPWDRVRRECPEMQDGNENLVGGPDNVRESVVILLIDEGIPNRGHRKTLLRSDWVYGACYKIGKVGMMPNCWVQKFGF